MDELQKLYDLLVREGKYTKSFDEFKVKWGTEEGYKDKVFDVVTRDGFYTKDKDLFFTKYTLGEEVKKKEEPFGPLPAEKVQSFTEFPSEVGPSVSPEPTKPTTEKVDKEQGWLLNMVSSIDKGAYNLPGEAVKGVGTLLEGVTGKGFVSDALKKFGTSYLKAIEELTPQDESFKNTLSDQFGQAFGQVAGMVLTGGASQAAKTTTALSAAEAALASQAAPKAVTIGGAVKKFASELSQPAAVGMGLAMGQGEFERAKQAGATDDQAFEAFYKNAVVGSVLENIPVMQFLKRFNKASAGGVANYLKTKAIGGLTGGTEEMTTEVLQQLYANQTAQDIYNINQDLFEGVGESGGIGFGVGFLLNAMGANAKLLRKQGKNDEADVIENQMTQFENAPQPPTGPPPSYSVSGINIADPVVINNMIDNMDGADLVNSNIEITNDPELKIKLQDKIVTSSIKEQVREANPDIDEESLNTLVDLEKELNKFENNKTQSGKDKAAQIRSQIKTIQEDAIQKQAAGEVPVQPRAGVSETLEEGKPQAEPQVTTTEGVTPEVKKEEIVGEGVKLVIDKEAIEVRGKDHTRYAIFDSNNNEVGSVSFNYREDLGGYQIENIKVSDAGMGIGTNAYRLLISQLDKPLISDSSRTKSADAVWNKLEKEGLVKFDEEQGKYFSIKPQVTPTEGIEEVVQEEVISKLENEKSKLTSKALKQFPQSPAQMKTRARIDEINAELETLKAEPETVSSKTLPKIVREDVRALTEEQITPAFEEIPMNLMPASENVSTQDAVFDAYIRAKRSGKHPEFVNTVEKTIYETLPTKGVQPEPGFIQPETKATTKPTGLAIPLQPSPKREEVKSSIQKIANAGLLRSAETGKPAITEQEIDAQMALTDAMAKVWQETTGKNNFYDTFIEDVKEGDVDAIAKKGGALFQNVELPQRPITRVTLGVFELPEFQKMKGIYVAPQSVSDLMKSRGKQIEKDVVNTVLSYDKYKGQKRISFDEFRDDVETQLMKLERIDTKTYASYGMDNLGDNHNYGKSQTIIFNSPIDHGQYGHFRADFTKGNLAPKTWEIRQIPNTEQYVAIDSEMPSGTPANEMSNYVGTAGPLVDVEKWINDRNSITDKEINKGLFGHIRNWFNENTGVYTLAELQSDYFQKNKANDLYASKISQDEVNEYVNKNFRRKLDSDTTEAIKKEFNIVVDYTGNINGDTISTATIKGFPNIPDDYVLSQNRYAASYVPVSGFTLEDVSENQTVVEALRVLATQNTDVAARRREIMSEYETKRLEIKKEENKYIAKRIEDIKKSEPANLMVNQFIASQKVHELRLFREALKHAADKGATELWFPTPYTIAVIEGYVSSTGNAPYEVINGDERRLEPGDTIDYGGTEMTVVESNGFSITVAPSDQVSVYDIDELRNDEVSNRMDELEYSLKRQVNDIKSITKEEAEEYNADDFLSEEILTQLKGYFENNPEEEVVSWREIEDDVRSYVEDYYNSASVEDLVGWAGDVYQEGETIYAVESRRATERLGQPSEYESNVDEDNFEENLSDEQYTVVKKYESLNDMMQKMRPDSEIVTDNNNKKWIKTSITESDASNPIIAFQEEGGKIKGAIDFSNDNKASIYLFDGADISTLAHEMSGHLGRRFLEQLSMVNNNFAKDYETAKKWAGVKDNQWTRAAEEKWARGFEKYLRTGKAPSKALTNVFKNLRTWLTNIYKTIKGSSIDVKLTPEIVSVFDNLLSTKEKPAKTKPVVEEGPTAEEIASIDAMLDLDVEDEDNMQRILNALDNADKAISKTLRGGAFESLLAIPLSTVQVVIKAIKVLVKGGMKLRDAIRKVAADNNISQDSVKDILNIAPIQDGFNEVMGKVDAMIERQKQRGTPQDRMTSNVDTLVRNTEVYQNANDAQKKIMEREARAKMEVSPRRAPSIGRILGAIKDITGATRQEKLKIISSIRALSKDAAKDLAKEIKDLATQGKITVNQAANIVSRFGKVNMLSEISVASFVDYMTNVFKDAEYASKLNTARGFRKSISTLSKNKEKNANLRELAKQFAEIDPAMVEDIDAYNNMASKIKEAVTGSSMKVQKISLAQTVNINEASEYINKVLPNQEKLMRERKAAEIQSLMGVDASEFSYEDMIDLLKKDKEITKYNEGIIRSTINKMFNVFSAMISENIKTGEDPITGEKIEYTKEQKRIINEFMNMDLGILEKKQALEAVDALANFLENKSTAKMGAMLATYKGLSGIQQSVNEKIQAYPLKKYGLEWLGKLLAENTTNLNILFERMFKGFNRGGRIQDLSGVTEVINNKAAAQKESSNKVKDYVDEFYEKLANGEAFNTAYNNVERGMSAFMQRSILGSESQVREFFNTRKKLVKQSMEALSDGNDKEKEKAALYQQAYDKLLKDSNSIDDVRGKTDATNLEAIKYWQNSWSEKYDQLYNTALNIYNKVLGRDMNYTPDRYSKLSSDTGVVELANDQSAFLNNNDVLYQKEAGVLMETTRPDALPKDRYLDFAFDNNNSNSYYEALVDMATAEPIRQVQAFLNSPLYKKLVPNADDARILKERIQLFINNFRNKNPYDNDEFSKFVRSLNVLADFGASMALGGITQPFKQVIPVAANTIFNAGDLDLTAPFNKAKNDFMSNSGYSIANRGVESQAQVQSMNKLVEEAAKSSPEKLLKLIKKGNQFYLKQFLVNADAYIARASWMTYYEKYLAGKGVDVKGIDYNTHEINKDAANYAQRMVDRQQNVSDADLSGKIFASKTPAVQLLVKTVMPFASFRMNQASRVGSDLAVVTEKTATKEDKEIAIRSLMGYAAETATFRLISAYFAYQLGTLGLKLLDRDESEEEKEKRKNNLIKGQVTGTVTDVLSPAPIADKFIQSKVNDLVGGVQTAMNIPLDKQYNIFGESKQDYVQNMGMYGIASERASQLFELSKLATTGKYTDDFGKEKTISEKDRETLKPYIGLGFLSSIGLAPSEASSVVRYMIKNAKKKPGKPTEEIEERAEKKEESMEQKTEALENIRKKTSNPNLIEAIDEKIDELEATPEEKEAIKEANKEERELKKELLTDPNTGEEYDNESKLKKYNKQLWNKNFGPQSDWYKEHRYEKEADRLMNREIIRMEDEEQGYFQPVKPKKRGKRNADGSIKRTYGRKK